MNTFVIAEIANAFGTLVVGGSAIYSIFSDHLQVIESGRLKKKGKMLVGLAIAGVVLSLSTQVAQYFGAIDSAETDRIRNEESSRRLQAVAAKLESEAIASTPLRRMTLIVYFAADVSGEGLRELKPWGLSLVVVRGAQSEFRMTASPGDDRRVSGIVQLEGRDQRVTVPLNTAVTYVDVADHFEWRGHRSASVWVDLGFNNTIKSLQESHDGAFEYWPYRTVADLKDCWFDFEVSGIGPESIEAAYLRLNEEFVMEFPPLENGRAFLRDPLTAIVAAKQ